MSLVSVPLCCSALEGSELNIGHGAASSEGRSQQQHDAGSAAAAVLLAGLLQLRASMAKKGKTTTKNQQKTPGVLYTCERKTNSYSILRAEQRPLPSGRLAEWQRGSARRSPHSAPCRQQPPRCALCSSQAEEEVRRRWGGASWWFGFIFLPKFAHKWSKGQMCVSASCWLILWDFFPLAPSPFTPQTISGSPIFKDRVLQLLLFFPSILTYCSVCENGNIMLVWFPWEHVQWPEVFLPSEFTALKLCCCPLNIHKVLFFNSEYMATWDCSDIWPFQTEILLIMLMGSSAEHGAVGWMGLSQRSAGTACSVSALCTLGHLLQETSPGWYFCWRKEFCFHVPCQSLSLNSQRQVSKKLI